MAIVFNTTSPSAASAALVAALVQSAWRDALTGHASGAWTLVEEFDSAGATVHWVVVKNNHLVSGLAVDFYVAIGRRASTGELAVCVGEGYNTSGHVLSTYAARTSSGATALNADGTYTSSSFTLGAALPSSTNEPMAGYTGGIVPAAATVKQTTHVDATYAILTHYLSSGNAMTHGFMVGEIGSSLIQAPSVDQPIIGVAQVAGTALSPGSLTRHPVEAATSAIKYPQLILSPEIGNFLINAANPAAVRMGNYFGGDRYQGGRVGATEVLMMMYAPFQGAGNSGPEVAGGTRGKFKAVRFAAVPDVSVPGDTVVIDSKKAMIIAKSTTPGTLSGAVSTTFTGLLMDTGAA